MEDGISFRCYVRLEENWKKSRSKIVRGSDGEVSVEGIEGVLSPLQQQGGQNRTPKPQIGFESLFTEYKVASF